MRERERVPLALGRIRRRPGVTTRSHHAVVAPYRSSADPPMPPQRLPSFALP